MNRLLLILALALAAPAFSQPARETQGEIRREEAYRPRHLLPLLATLGALGLLGLALWRSRRARAEALERL